MLEKTKILLIVRTNEEDIIRTIRESETYEILGYASREEITGLTLPYV